MKKTKKIKRKNLTVNIVALVTVFLLMASAAMVRDGKIFGHDFKSSEKDNSAVPVMTAGTDGSTVINTSSLDVGVTGYSGPVPVEITVKDGVIAAVRPLDNVETPAFFNLVTESDIFSAWVGKTPQEALEAEVDGVTGATYSSNALIAGVRAGLREYTDSPVGAGNSGISRGVSFYAALLVLLMAAIIPIYVKDKRYRIVQEVLNVAVLGFWTGTFVDFTLILGAMSNGLGLSVSLITCVLFLIAFIYPLFGYPGYYCAWVCPFGSLQELASRCNPRFRLHVGKRAAKILRRFRTALWMALMLCLWTGFLTSWIDYELFTAFIVKTASVGVLVAGGVFVLLSFFVQRPYCNYVCPTGTLLRMSQDLDSK